MSTADSGGKKALGSVRMTDLPWDLLEKLAVHYTKGKIKYPDGPDGKPNWRQGYPLRVSMDALSRHLSAFLQGETYCPETDEAGNPDILAGQHHLLAVEWHALFGVFITEQLPEHDDRWIPPAPFDGLVRTFGPANDIVGYKGIVYGAGEVEYDAQDD